MRASLLTHRDDAIFAVMTEQQPPPTWPPEGMYPPQEQPVGRGWWTFAAVQLLVGGLAVHSRDEA